MGFITNVLEYGWNAGCIITKAERVADKICKGIKTTVVEEDERTKTGENTESDENPYGFRIIFHPEWMSKEGKERMQQDEQCEPEATENIKYAHADIMDCMD